jgi:MYXO-CTERM domain-containing protein
LKTIARPLLLRAAALTCMALTAGLTVSRAGVIQSTVVLPPLSGAYTLGGICVSLINRCAENVTVFGFNIVTHNEVSGNEVVGVTAQYSADVFMNNGGNPGSFLGHLSLSGPATFTYVGRDPGVNPLGTFQTILTDFDFTGTLNGNTFEVRQDASQTSSGSTTILAIPLSLPVQYAVNGSLEIFGEFSLNGGPFVPAPPRMGTVNPPPAVVPEPGSATLAGTVLLAVLGIASRRRRR